ncbi:protein C3orf33 [Ditylenchus destructor]|nr:protein C3orf33 [Ditylenchus destructor]
MTDAQPGPLEKLDAKPPDGAHIVDPMDRYYALGIRAGIAGMALIGLGLYVKNSRYFARFQHVNRIPADYFQKELGMKGIVREVTTTGLIKVEHHPLVNLRRFSRRKFQRTDGLLNLRLAGLDVSNAGLSYLSKDVRIGNKPVTFTVIKIAENNSDAADADVTVRKNYFSQTNLNVDLVRRGYARVSPPTDSKHMAALQTNSAYSRLISRLLMCEKVADRRGVGVWERSTWVESLRSIPATLVQRIKASAVTKLLIIAYDIAKSLVFISIELARQLYFLAIALAGYSRTALTYARQGADRFSQGVDRFSNFYHKQKSKIRSITESKKN